MALWALWMGRAVRTVRAVQQVWVGTGGMGGYSMDGIGSVGAIGGTGSMGTQPGGRSARAVPSAGRRDPRVPHPGAAGRNSTVTGVPRGWGDAAQSCAGSASRGHAAVGWGAGGSGSVPRPRGALGAPGVHVDRLRTAATRYLNQNPH